MLLTERIPTQPASVEIESEVAPPPVEGDVAQAEEPVYEARQTDYLLLAIILSSDGDVRVVKRVGERVVMWRGLDSPELGL